MKRLIILFILLIPITAHAGGWFGGAWSNDDSVGTSELFDGNNTPSQDFCVTVATDDTTMLNYRLCNATADTITSTLANPVTLTSGGLTTVGCLMMYDTDLGGWTECFVLNGTMNCTSDNDGICDGS